MASYKFDKDKNDNLHIEKEGTETSSNWSYHLIIVEAEIVRDWYRELQRFMAKEFQL